MTWQTVDNPANNGKQVSLEGYARLPVSNVGTDSMLIELHEKPDGKGQTINFDVPFGSGPSQLEEPPKEYTDKDMKLHASDGKLVGLNDKVRVSGELTWMKEDNSPGGRVVWLSAPIVVDRI